MLRWSVALMGMLALITGAIALSAGNILFGSIVMTMGILSLMKTRAIDIVKV